MFSKLRRLNFLVKLKELSFCLYYGYGKLTSNINFRIFSCELDKVR